MRTGTVPKVGREVLNGCLGKACLGDHAWRGVGHKFATNWVRIQILWA